MSIASPLIGAGSVGFTPERAKAVILEGIQEDAAPPSMVLVLFKRR